MSGSNSFLAYKNELSSIGTEILMPELNMCLPYKNYTFFKNSGRFPDLLDEIYAAKASKRDLKASATFFRKFACGLGFAGAEKVNFSTEVRSLEVQCPLDVLFFV